MPRILGQPVSANKSRYGQRSDLEKLQAQWNKLTGLSLRDEPSAAIVRCATAAEIAASYAVRTEWAKKTEFDAATIDMFLLWANGLKLKVERLFVPIYFKDSARDAVAKILIKHADRINCIRNSIVHQGHFCNPAEAQSTIKVAEIFINTIVGLSKTGFDIKLCSNQSLTLDASHGP